MRSPSLLEFILLFGLFLNAGLAEQSDDPVAELQRTYEQALDLANEPLSDLSKGYTGALGKLKEKVQKEGDLQKALMIESEIERYSEEGERDFRSLPELQRLRKIYEENRDQKQKAVDVKCLDILKQSVKKFEQLTENLTKQGNLDAAVRSTEAREVVLKRIERISGAGESAEPETAEMTFEEWLERVTFVVPGSGTIFKYRDGYVEVERSSTLDERNKARIRNSDLRIVFEAEAGPAFIQVERDRQSAVYMLNSRLAAKLRVVESEEK